MEQCASLHRFVTCTDRQEPTRNQVDPLGNRHVRPRQRPRARTKRLEHAPGSAPGAPENQPINQAWHDRLASVSDKFAGLGAGFSRCPPGERGRSAPSGPESLVPSERQGDAGADHEAAGQPIA
jgi:hypothetical protein